MTKRAYIILLCGLFLLSDQILKWISLNLWLEKKLLIGGFGWYPFKNYGVSFGIPLPNWLVILFSVPVLFLIIFLLKKAEIVLQQYALYLIIFGAISNLFDRVYYKFTADYLLILTGVINIGDMMIVAGFILYFFSIYKQKGVYVSKT